MLIITNLRELLKSNMLEKATPMNVQVNYRADDTISINEHERLANSKLKFTFKETEENAGEQQASVFEIGFTLGSMLNGSETVIYVTDIEELLSVGKITNGKATALFVRTFDEAIKMSGKAGKTGKAGKETVRKSRKRRTSVKEMPAAVEAETEAEDNADAEVVDEKESSGVEGNMNAPVAEEKEMPEDESNDAEDLSEDAAATMITQKTIDYERGEDATSNVKAMLEKLDPEMVPAYRYIMDALHDANKPIEVGLYLPMVVDKPYVEKWEKTLEEYFDELKAEVNKIHPFSHVDDIYS